MQHTQHACVCGQNCLNFATGSFTNFGRKSAPKQAYSNSFHCAQKLSIDGFCMLYRLFKVTGLSNALQYCSEKWQWVECRFSTTTASEMPMFVRSVASESQLLNHLRRCCDELCRLHSRHPFALNISLGCQSELALITGHCVHLFVI